MIIIQTLHIHDDDILCITSLLTIAASWNHCVDSCTSVRSKIASLHVWYGKYWPRPSKYTVADFCPCVFVGCGVSGCHLAFYRQRVTKLYFPVCYCLYCRGVCLYKKIHLSSLHSLSDFSSIRTALQATRIISHIKLFPLFRILLLYVLIVKIHFLVLLSTNKNCSFILL